MRRRNKQQEKEGRRAAVGAGARGEQQQQTTDADAQRGMIASAGNSATRTTETQRGRMMTGALPAA